MIGPFAEDEFVSDDIQALVSYEYRKRVQPVVSALEDIFGSLENRTRCAVTSATHVLPTDSRGRESLAALISAASSIVSAIRLPDPSEAGLFNAPQRPRLRNYQLLNDGYT